MIRPETYYKIANEFATGVGVAEWEGNFYPHYTNVSKIPDEMKIIVLTNYMIQQNIYQQVIKEVLRLEVKYKNKRINKSTIYEKALDMVM